MFRCSLCLSVVLASSACRGNQDANQPELAADGRRHYASYSAAGEVTNRAGVVDIYAATHANSLSLAAARARPLVYVPNSRSASVTVIDPTTYAVVRTFDVGQVPQHVVASYDLTRLWVLNNASSSLTPIDPLTGRDGKPVHVDDPYNMYFTPDGRFAIVVAERRERLDFLDPRSMRPIEEVPTACRGIDHLEFTADGRFVIATCEFKIGRAHV